MRSLYIIAVSSEQTIKILHVSHSSQNKQTKVRATSIQNQHMPFY